MKTDVKALLGASALVILGIAGLVILLAVVVGAAFEHLIENVILQRGVSLWTWATFWKGLAVEILAVPFWSSSQQWLRLRVFSSIVP